MKKIISIILILTLIFTFPVTANTNINDVKKQIIVKLPLSVSENDKTIYNESLVQRGNNQYFEFSTMDKTKFNTNSNIMLKINDINVVDNGVVISGSGQFSLGLVKYSFDIENVQLNVFKTSNGKTVYDGAIETKIKNKKYENAVCILDVTFLEDFSKGTISMTLGELDGESGFAMIFWGDVFPEQQEVYNLNKNNTNINYEKNTLNSLNQEIGIMSASGGYDHVANKYNSSLGGTTYTKEMIVISVSKADFRDRQSDLGNEMIRIFSRSYNVDDVMATVLLAQPTSYEAIFQSSTSNFLDITQTTPRSGSNSLSFNFPILEYLYPEAGPIIAYVNLLIQSLSGSSATLSDTLGDGHYNKAVIKSNITTGYTNVDLPSNSSYSYAHTNTNNGVSAEIDFNQRPDAGTSASVTSKARLTYRLYLNTDRTSSATTGYASSTHTIYGY